MAKEVHLFQAIILGIHVSFQGCIHPNTVLVPNGKNSCVSWVDSTARMFLIYLVQKQKTIDITQPVEKSSRSNISIGDLKSIA